MDQYFELFFVFLRKSVQSCEIADYALMNDRFLSKRIIEKIAKGTLKFGDVFYSSMMAVKPNLYKNKWMDVLHINFCVLGLMKYNIVCCDQSRAFKQSGSQNQN